MNEIEPFEGKRGAPANEPCGFNGLVDDVFIPVGMYVNDNDINIVFDTGCSVAVTPYREDFIGPITKVDKTMRGLGTSVTVDG